MSTSDSSTLAGLGPPAEHYFLVARTTAHGTLFWRETREGGMFGGEHVATRYETTALAHGAVLRFEIDPADVVERVSRRCCTSPRLQSFTCDGSGGSYELEWCSACGSLRFEEHLAGTEKKFCDWIRPSAPDPGRWKQLLGALVGTLPKCDECSAPATRAFRRGEGRWCDAHAGQAERCTSGGVSDPNGAYLRLARPPEYPRAEPLRAAIAALKESK